MNHLRPAHELDWAPQWPSVVNLNSPPESDHEPITPVSSTSESEHEDEHQQARPVATTPPRTRHRPQAPMPAPHSPSVSFREPPLSPGSGQSGSGDWSVGSSSTSIDRPYRTRPGVTKRAGSRVVSTTSLSSFRKPYPSTKLKGEIYKYWNKYPDPAIKYCRIIYWCLVAGGVLLGAAIVFLGYRSIPQVGQLCLVMDDRFSSGAIDSQWWSHEVQVDGFGNGEFEWTTTSSNNSFVQDNTLYIVPTLTADVLGEAAVLNGFNLNLTTDGTCTSTNVSACFASSNSSTGSIINPVRSARLITKGKANIRYGKVEVTAKMPKGDWLWPAIWMMPENNTYGDWPRSGEIDIAESRGNGFNYAGFGLDWISSSLHWGPSPIYDPWRWTTSQRQNRVYGYHSDYHTYTLEWTENFVITYLMDIDSMVYNILNIKTTQPFWQRGKFPSYYTNGSEIVPLTDPWVGADTNAPFDQSFYLIVNLAVGGTNGYFPDGLGGKPWQDGALAPMRDFWKAKDQWYSTWPTDPAERGLAIKSVKMWQKC